VTPVRGRQALQVGIVGCGFAAATRHLPALGRVREAEVVALADTDPAAGERVARAFGVARRYVDPAELIADPEVEAVAVCVPAAAHAEVASAALEAGRHVLVEKPLAVSLEDADRLIDAAERSPAATMVGFNMRFHRLIREARALVGAGALGRIVSVRGEFTDTLERPPGAPEWRGRRDLGGGALMEKAVHHFDLWRSLLQDEVEEVHALTVSDGTDDETCVVSARTSGGALASVLVSDRTSVANRIELHGERGSVAVDCYRSDGLARSSLSDLPGAPRTRMRHAARAALALARASGEIRRGGVFDASYDAEWRHFAAAVRRGTRPECGLADGRRALEVALAAAHSAELGEPMGLGSPLEVAR
jgi:myo-inositol 2-dehydrogenase / D-chiro-inositol 1-dehydrogenase